MTNRWIYFRKPKEEPKWTTQAQRQHLAKDTERKQTRQNTTQEANTMSNKEPHQKNCGWTHINLRWYERRLIPKSPLYNTTQETKTWGEHILIYGYAENNTQQALRILCWFIFSLNVKILVLGSYVGVDPKLRQKKSICDKKCPYLI